MYKYYVKKIVTIDLFCVEIKESLLISMSSYKKI